MERLMPDQSKTNQELLAENFILRQRNVELAQSVSDCKWGEEALLESELLWRLSIENMIEAYALHEAIFDENGRMVDYRFLEFNPTAQRISNIAREKIVGRTALEMYPLIVERGLMDRYADVMATGIPAVIEDFQYTGDSLAKALDISCFRIDSRHFVCVFSDITARMQAEEALRETNETLGTLIQSSPLAIIALVAIIALDPEGNVTRWNPAAEHIFGWSEREALGRFLPIVSEDKQEENLKLRERVLQGEAFTNVEVRRCKKDGSPIDISISIAPLRNSQGRITGIMSVSTDVTTRKRAEAALRESEERYRYFVEESFAGVYVVENERFVFLNENAASFAGYKPTELIGKGSYSITHPDDIEKIKEKSKRMLTGEETSPYEFRIITKDGRIRWVMETVKSIQ
jgi:PAS domain S-box-containing protein